MRSTKQAAFSCAILVFLSGGVASQEWTEGADHVREWKKFVPTKCGNCNGKKKVACTRCKGEKGVACARCSGKRRIRCSSCGGKGRTLDPFAFQQCGPCAGGGVIGCVFCRSRGRFRVRGGGKNTKCPCCDGRGAYVCRLCSGKGWIKGVRPGGLDPRRASEAQLLRAEKLLAKAQDEFAGMHGFSQNEKQVKKDFARIVSRLNRDMPAFKSYMSCFGGILKGIRGGKGYTSYRGNAHNVCLHFKKTTVKMIMAQRKIIKKCLAVVRHNKKLQENRR